MKRTEALRPLSRDHHAALVAAKALRDAADPEPARVAFLEFWHEHGSQHFRVEEEVLLPGWALHAEVDRAAVARMLEDHLAIRREALRLESGAVPVSELHELGTRLEKHVRFEERELFAMIEEALDPEALDRLAGAIEEAERAG
jgi:hypothetical protein